MYLINARNMEHIKLVKGEVHNSGLVELFINLARLYPHFHIQSWHFCSCRKVKDGIAKFSNAVT
jgi:hypothetical protein